MVGAHSLYFFTLVIGVYETLDTKGNLQRNI